MSFRGPYSDLGFDSRSAYVCTVVLPYTVMSKAWGFCGVLDLRVESHPGA